MKRKKSKPKTARKPKLKANKDPRVEATYEKIVEFMCPVRGLVKQKVKVKRMKSAAEIEAKHVIATNNDFDKLDQADSGLDLYGEVEGDNE